MRARAISAQGGRSLTKRRCSRGSGDVDPRCAAPHLALAALLAAGTRGIVDGALLEVGDCAKPVVEMSEEERLAVGLGKDPVRLPRSIGEAREALRLKLPGEIVCRAR